MWSDCTQSASGFACSFDAYPWVAACLTLVGLTFWLTQWHRIHTYQDITDVGWAPQPASKGSQVVVALLMTADAVKPSCLDIAGLAVDLAGCYDYSGCCWRTSA